MVCFVCSVCCARVYNVCVFFCVVMYGVMLYDVWVCLAYLYVCIGVFQRVCVTCV